MHILYFPYTHLSDDTAETLSACFGKITVYQSTARHTPAHMRARAEAGTLALRAPASAFSPQIEEHLHSFQALGTLYGGKPGGITNFPRPEVAFRDENGPSKIQADLKRMIQEGTSSTSSGQAPADPIIQACVFLQLAQEFDTHQEALGQNLRDCEAMENELFNRLKAGDDNDPEEALGAPSSGLAAGGSRRSHMLAQRLAAWARLYVYDRAVSAPTAEALDVPTLLVTTDRLAFDELIAQSAAEPVFFDLTAERTEGGNPELADLLGRLANGELTAPPPALPDSTAENSIRIHAALISNLSPDELLAPCAGIDSSGNATGLPPRLRQNALICLVPG